MKQYRVFLAGLVMAAPLFAAAQTVDQQAQLNALLQMLAQLQAQLAAQTGGGTTVATPVQQPVTSSWHTCLSYSMNLKEGFFDTSGNPGPIASLQQYLQSTGDFNHEPTGFWGPLTTAAVRSWQAKNGIVSSGTPETTGFGVLGPRTRDALKAVTCRSTTPTVTQTTNPVPTPVTVPVQPVVPVAVSCLIGSTYVPSGTSLLMYSRASVSPLDSCSRYSISRTCVNGTLSGDASYVYPSCDGSAAGSCVIGGIVLANGESRTFYTVGSILSQAECASHSQVRTCVSGVLSGDANYLLGGCAVTGPRSCSLDGISVASGISKTFYSQRLVPSTSSCSVYGYARPCTDGTLGGPSVYQYGSCTTSATSTCTVGNVTLQSGASQTFYSQTSVGSGACSSYAQARTCTGGILDGSDTYQYPTCLDTTTSCTLDGATLANGATTTAYLVQNVSSSDSCSYYSTVRTCANGTLSGNSSYQYRTCSTVSSGSCALDNIVVANGASHYFYSQGVAPAGARCTSYRLNRTCTNGVLSGSASYNRATCVDNTSCTLDGVTVADGASRMFFSASSVAYGTLCSSVAQTRTCTNGDLSGSDTYAYAACTVSPPVSLSPVQAQLAAIAESLKAILASLSGN